MSDQTFETQLARQLRAYAEGGVRPVARFVVAEEAIAAGRTGGRWRLGLGSLRGNRALVPLLVGLLLAALAGGVLFVGSRLLAPSRPILGVFEPVGPMPIDARRAVVLPDGRVVVVGTDDAFGTGPAFLYTFDPGSGRSALLGKWAGFQVCVTALRDGRILIVGAPQGPSGRLESSFGFGAIFDPATGRSTEVGKTVVPRYRPAAVTLLDGRVLLVGGVPDYSTATATATAEIFDPATGRFMATGTMSQPRGLGVTATLLGDGRVLVAGGAPGDANGTAELYDPSTGTFAMTGRMSAPRTDFTATLLRDGRVLFAGGLRDGRRVMDAVALNHRGMDEPVGYTDDRFGTVAMATDGDIYDPSTGTFAPTSPMQLPRVGHVAAMLRDGRVLIAGGMSTPELEERTQSAEIFDPKSGTFAPTGSLNAARGDNDAAVLPDGGVLVFGNFNYADWSLGPLLNARTAEVFR